MVRLSTAGGDNDRFALATATATTATGKMGSSSRDKEAEIKYADELITLRVNSKPLINSLTMMAEDYIKQAPIIVGTIEKHLSKCRTDVKLPCLYLIDSILKNVKRDYVPLFAHNLVTTFCSVFERADEKTRMQMYKLRQTWSEIFPPNKLYQLDIKAHTMDPGWPVAKLPPSSNVHVNPKFINKKPLSNSSHSSPSTSPKSFEEPTHTPVTSASSLPISEEDEVRMREELLIKQKELIELQQRKLELELLQTQSRLAEQARRKAIKENDKEKEEKLLKQAEVARERTNKVTSIIAKVTESIEKSTQQKQPPRPKSPELSEKMANLSTASSSGSGSTLNTSNSSTSSSLVTGTTLSESSDYASDPRLSRTRVSHMKSDSREKSLPKDHRKEKEQKSPKKSKKHNSSNDGKDKIVEPKTTKSELTDNKDHTRSKAKSDGESSRDKESWDKSRQHDSPDRPPKDSESGSQSSQRSRTKSESSSPEKRGKRSRDREEFSSSSRSPRERESEGEKKSDRFEADKRSRKTKEEDRETVDNRRIAVLSKIYRKRGDPTPEPEERSEINVHPAEPAAGDIDLRIIGSQYHDMKRTTTDSSQLQHEPEPVHMRRNIHMQPNRGPRGRHFQPNQRGRRGQPPNVRGPSDAWIAQAEPSPWTRGGGGGRGNRNRNFPGNFPDIRPNFPEMQQNVSPWAPGWFPPGIEPQPLNKKPRRGAFIEDLGLFGQQDVDLRPMVGPDSNWTNLKRPSPWQETGEPGMDPQQPKFGRPEEQLNEMRLARRTLSTEEVAGMVSNASSAGPLNVQDLLSKLLASGLLPNVDKKQTEQQQQSDAKVKEEADESSAETPMDTAEPQEPKTEKEEAVSTGPPPLEVVNVTFSDNMREKRAKLVDQICIGVQCASCGLRFPPDQSLRYTQHLDWHFRLNRKEKANSRKAQSRRWYYDLSDWIQFEEIEDLEERAASLFEFQEPEKAEGEGAETAPLLNPDAYTVLASDFEGALCPQCGEGFETFYDGEEEEWRLRDALAEAEPEGESKPRLFHPICHEDYAASLARQAANESMEESTTEAEGSSLHTDSVPIPSELDVTDSDSKQPPKQDDDEDEVLILKEGKKEVVLMEIALEEDDPALNSDNEGKSDKITKDNENETEKTNDLTSNIVNNNSKPVLSPIVIQVEDDSIIPGITSAQGGGGGGVFDFALSYSNQQQQQNAKEELPQITYNSMQFDFPKIKVEPPEWDQLDENQVIMSKEFMVKENQSPMDITLDDDSPPPTTLASQQLQQDDAFNSVDIDLTEEDDEGSQSAPLNTLVTAIDGNLEMRSEAKSPLMMMPTKIRINISGVEKPSESQSPSHPASSQEDRSPNPNTDTDGAAEPGPDADSKKLESSEHSEKVLEEIKRLKPRLVGKKLVNCPPKKTGKEESGLCVIC